MHRLLPALAVIAVLMISACSHDDEPKASSTSPSPATTTRTPAGTGTASPAVTAAPPLSPTSSAAASPTATRADGTVSPEGFGSTEPVTVKSNPDPLSDNAVLRDVRIGVHPEEGGWDRLVFEFQSDLPPAQIAYVQQVSACGSGAPVTVRGAAVLAVTMRQTAAHTEAGQPTIGSATIAGPGTTILEARQTCDFEGVVAWAVGVKGTQRFKVTKLANPPRIVIDIKH